MENKKYEVYNHHRHLVWVHKDLKGKHREMCLCHSCKRLDTNDREKNCVIASILYAVCVAHGLTTPVFECPSFVEKE